MYLEIDDYVLWHVYAVAFTCWARIDINKRMSQVIQGEALIRGGGSNLGLSQYRIIGEI